jgi:hypothetical protein
MSKARALLQALLPCSVGMHGMVGNSAAVALYDGEATYQFGTTAAVSSAGSLRRQKGVSYQALVLAVRHDHAMRATSRTAGAQIPFDANSLKQPR